MSSIPCKSGEAQGTLPGALPDRPIVASDAEQAAGVLAGEATQRAQGHPQEEGRLAMAADKGQNTEGISRDE